MLFGGAVFLLWYPSNVLGVGVPSSLADHCHSLLSLPLPPVAVGTLPKFELADFNG